MTTPTHGSADIDHGTPVTEAPSPYPTVSGATQVVLFLLRIALGFTFFWAFLDKLFGFGYSTPSSKSWINGGNPTKGFLSNVDVGPLQGFYHSIAGTWWANLLFMIGLGAIGLAFIVGAGMRLAGWTGALMMLMMWAAEWPPAKLTAGGDPTGSANPIVDYHIIYALAGLTLMFLGAGRYFGLGTWWSRVVGSQRWLE